MNAMLDSLRDMWALEFDELAASTGSEVGILSQ